MMFYIITTTKNIVAIIISSSDSYFCNVCICVDVIDIDIN